jgi:apolipoprotein N-acyltransferase
VFPREAPQSAGRQEAHDLPRLRLAAAPRSLPISIAAAAASGILLWLSLPPADAGPLAFVALVPVLWSVRGARPRRGALLGLVFGVAYYAPLLWWIMPLSILAWTVLVAGVSAFHAMTFAFVAAVWDDDRPIRTAVAAGAAYALVDQVRAAFPFEGWAWVSAGDTQHDNPLLLPLASVIGAVGLTAVVVAVNALVVAILVRVGEWRRAAVPAVVAVVLALGPAVIPVHSPGGRSVDVAVIQGSVPVGVGTESRIIEDRIVAENHAALHLRLAEAPPDLAVWPENALDQDPTRDPSLGGLVGDAVRTVGAPTVIGAITADGVLRNEDLLYDPEGSIVDRYAKAHLLPFGEYVPFRDALDWIPDVRLVRADLTPGSEPGRFTIPAGSFAAIICFENAFPSLVREYVTEDTGFLVVSTNNSTFGFSAAPEQHLVLSELRAVESGRWVVHGALSGISALISPEGEVVARTGLFRREVLRGRIVAADGRTPYDVVGGWLPLLWVAIAGWAFLRPRRAAHREPEPIPHAPRTAVILPTYDERDTIEDVLDRVLAATDVDVLVVDDSSPDGTGDVVRRYTERRPRVALEERSAKGGLASAYLHGFGLALQRGYDLVVEMDADLSHRPEELPRLLEGARRHHLVIGSRYIPGGAVRNWSRFRRTLSQGGNLYARLLLGFPVRDATSGYRVYRADALRRLIDEELRSEGYAFQVELAYRAWREGMSVGEVPITFEERHHGQSKLSRAIVVEALWHVLVWAIRDRLLRRGVPAAPGRRSRT